MVGGRYDEQGRYFVLQVVISAVLIAAVERQMRDELVPRGDGSSEVEGEDHLRDFGEIDGDAAPLHDSANDITPFDIERPASG